MHFRSRLRRAHLYGSTLYDTILRMLGHRAHDSGFTARPDPGQTTLNLISTVSTP